MFHARNYSQQRMWKVVQYNHLKFRHEFQVHLHVVLFVARDSGEGQGEGVNGLKSLFTPQE